MPYTALLTLPLSQRYDSRKPWESLRFHTDLVAALARLARLHVHAVHGWLLRGRSCVPGGRGLAEAVVEGAYVGVLVHRRLGVRAALRLAEVKGVAEVSRLRLYKHITTHLSPPFNIHCLGGGWRGFVGGGQGGWVWWRLVIRGWGGGGGVE